ncbi:MAG: recombinase family protein [Candidatus Pacearchaeota archaeon]
MHQSKRVGIFIRVSTDMQVQEESPEHHIMRAELYIEAKGWEVVEIYRLDGVSGKSIMEHPETKRMLADIKRGHITGLVFSKLARIARNTIELLQLSKIFQTHHADLISLSESIDTSSPAGRFFFSLISALSEWEREEISSRVAASVPIRAKLGKPLGGAAPFGYRWDNKILVIDEAEAPIRKLMYELFLIERRVQTTANKLNAHGYRTRKGELFSDNTVYRLLRDPMAKGTRRANYTKSGGSGKPWELKPTDEWVLIPCPAIVSIDLWEQCNQILDEQQSKRTKSGRKAQHLLTGFVICHCGTRMYIRHAAGNYQCSACKNRILGTDLDTIYQEYLNGYLTNQDPETYHSTTTEELNSLEARYNQSIAERAKIAKRMEQLVNLRLDGELDKDAFKEVYKPLETRLLQIETMLPSLEAEIDVKRIQQLSTETVLAEAKSLADHWQTMSFDDRRAIVETITNQIVIGTDSITISFAYQPTLSHNQVVRVNRN